VSKNRDLFERHLVLVRGGGDLATGVVARLHRAGFPVIVCELAEPLAVRRTVALSSAVDLGTIVVEDLSARLTPVGSAEEAARAGDVAVVVSPHLPDLPVSVVVDARLAKRNIDTSRGDAPVVIALGPGFVAGIDCHAVVETNRGHRLGRVLWTGSAEPNTGTPGLVAGRAAERVLRAPADGVVVWLVQIGDVVTGGQQLGSIEGSTLVAPFDGLVRGLIRPGHVRAFTKIADIDARLDPSMCVEISDKALAVGGGVLEAVLMSLARLP
jgi:xanthine dehydrogenase accessory factor